MAASKLNTEHKVVLAFSESYNRILVYPARAKKENPTEEEKAEELHLDRLNQRALKEMLARKKQGHIILVFPSGTRYRPGNPESKEALQQIMSFIRAFDYFCFVGIAGNALMVNPSNQMSEDIFRKDTLVYLIDEVRDCKEFLAEVKKQHACENKTQHKDATAKEITLRLKELHSKAAALREPLVKDNPPKYLGPFLPS